MVFMFMFIKPDHLVDLGKIQLSISHFKFLMVQIGIVGLLLVTSTCVQGLYTNLKYCNNFNYLSPVTGQIPGQVTNVHSPR